MKGAKIVLIVLFDIIFLGASVVYLPVLIQLFSNHLTAILFTGAMIAGGGIVIAMGFVEYLRSVPNTSGTNKDGGRSRRHM